MASFANLSIADGQASPVAHSFTTGANIMLPDGTMRFSWLDFSVNGGVGIGANRVDLDVRMPVWGARNRPAKAGDSSQQLAVAYKFVLPTLETLSNNTASGVNPQPTHGFDTTVWVKVVRNGRAGQQPVKDALAFARNFSQLSVLTDALLNYAPPAN